VTARQGVGVAAALGAGAELELAFELELDVREDEADDDAEDDVDELDDVAVSESFVAVAVSVDDGADDELSAVELAGACVVGDVGVGVVSDDDELSLSSPRVVDPEEVECVTSADTGFCPISSIPVTIAIATTNTDTA